MTYLRGVSGNPGGIAKDAKDPHYSAGYWRTLVARAPLWLLEDELARRREADLAVAAIRVSPDLLVDPVASLVSWRGDDYQVSGRQMEICYSLALAWLQGRPRMRAASLAGMVWRGWDAKDAAANLRTTIGGIRRQIPDLIGGGRVAGVGYHFNVRADTVAHRVDAA